MHYATHHFPMRWGFLGYLKRHHMLHHYKTPDLRFGVSSPFWDWVYGTLPKDFVIPFFIICGTIFDLHGPVCEIIHKLNLLVSFRWESICSAKFGLSCLC